MSTHTTGVERQAARAKREVAPWVEKLARFGYFAKGIVYALVGGLAMQAAFGAGRATGTKGAIQEIGAQPFGQFLLGLIAVGLLGYAIWRVVQAITDPDNEGGDAKGIAARIGFAASGVGYAFLAWYAFQLMSGSGGGGGNSTQSYTAKLMSQPWGQWLVGIVGLIVIGSGLYQIYKGYAAKFLKNLYLTGLSADGRQWAIASGRIGYIARGIVFGIIGIFLVVAAVQTNPSEARGLGGALRTLAQQPFGPWVLAAVAAGLIAFGIYSVVEARYRRIVVR